MNKNFDNNEAMAFQIEEKNLEDIEVIIDKEITDACKRKEKYYGIVINKEYNHIDDKFEYLRMVASCEGDIDKYSAMKPSPYYGRIDVSRDGGNVETYFVGYDSLLDGSASKIVSWRSPLGNTFYQKSAREFQIQGYRYALYLRRSIDIKNQKLLKVKTEYDIDNLSLDGEVIDPFLISVLQDKRKNHLLTDIIRTIQENQNAIISKPLETEFVVQGCAGSGKTMILLHRLSYLVFNYPNCDFAQWCILTPNEQFNVYIQDLSSKLDIQEIKRFTVEEYYKKMLEGLLLKEFAKDDDVVIKVQSEKMLSSDMLHEIYSLDFRNRVIKTYNQIWIDALARLEEKGYYSLVKEFVSLVPSMNFKLPNTAEHKVSTYGTLQSILYSMRTRIVDNRNKYNKAIDRLNQLNPKIKSAESDCEEINQKITRCKKLLIDKIENNLNEVLADISKNNNSINELKTREEFLRKQINDFERQVMELSVVLEIEEKSTVDSLYRYIQEKRHLISSTVLDTLRYDFQKTLELKTAFERIPIYNFGKRNTEKNKYQEAERAFARKVVSIFEGLNRENEVLKKELQMKAEETTALMNSVKTELSEKQKNNLNLLNKRALLDKCLRVCGNDPFVAKRILVTKEYEELHDWFKEYFDAISDLVKSQKNNNELYENRDEQERIIGETKLLATRDDMLEKIDELREFLRGKLDYATIKKELLKLRNNVYKEYGFKTNKKSNYRHKMYNNLLIASLYYSNPKHLHNYINIDEAQDIAITEYLLFKEVLGEKSVFNLYGDVNQLIYDYKGITDWSDLEFVNDNVYLLNENYRNTVQITQYCNNVFGADVTAIGLSGSDVVECEFADAIIDMLKNVDSNNRRCIIYKRGVDGLRNIISSLVGSESLVWDMVDPQSISVIPVEMAKGLEFESVIVVSNYMTENEKYISYTRALEKLYVSNCDDAVFVEFAPRDDRSEAYEENIEYSDSVEKELLEKYAAEFNESPVIENNHIEVGIEISDSISPVILGDKPEKVHLEKGVSHVVTFFDGNIDLAKKFMIMGKYLQKNHSNVYIKASCNYIGFANPKPNNYCMMYVSKPRKGKYNIKFIHNGLTTDFANITENKLLAECDAAK